MSEANGKVCCNCRHNKRYCDEYGVFYCVCEVTRRRLGYVKVLIGWCRHWAKDKAESEDNDGK